MNHLKAVVTLAGELVSSDDEDSLTYSFSPDTRQRGLDIVRSSLYPFPITHLEVKDGMAVATLEGPVSAFKEAYITESDSAEWDLVNALVDNYGNGAADGWMEGDIYLDDEHELWLGLVSVAFYRNNQLYMLFEDLPN